MFRRLLIVLSFCCMLSACCGVREAQQTVATADSLRVNRSVAYGNGVPTSNMQRGVGDSIALAQAYQTFGRVQHIYPNDYARACYYYGRLLRNHGDQVAAMQAFINGSHAPYWHRLIPLPQFTDYHILGRIYSNMGTMCHLVDAFELSYEMYELSSKAFREANDTTAYYFALNSMAYELAEQNLHDETLSLIHTIEQECTDENVLTKTWETKARLYLNIALYDSAIVAVNELYTRGYQATTGYVIEAQSYWCMEEYDSAVYYAQSVMNNPYASAQDKYHMLYLVVNHDTTISTKDIQSLASERADLDYQLIEPLLQQLSIANELLISDYKRETPFTHFLFPLLALSVIGGIAWMTRIRIKKYRLYEQEKQLRLAKENAMMQSELQRLCTHTEKVRKENIDLLKQQTELREKRLHEIEKNCETIRNISKWKDELHWKNYEEFCVMFNQYFFMLASKLKAQYQLDEKQIRLCFLVLLDMYSNKELADLLIYSESGMGTFKNRLSHKLHIQTQNLRKFLVDTAIS